MNSRIGIVEALWIGTIAFFSALALSPAFANWLRDSAVRGLSFH